MRKESPECRVPFLSRRLCVFLAAKNLYYSHFPFAHPVLQLVLFDPSDLRDPGEGLLALLPPSGLPHVQILQNRNRRIIYINCDPGEGLLTLLRPSRLPHVQILQNRNRRIIKINRDPGKVFLTSLCFFLRYIPTSRVWQIRKCARQGFGSRFFGTKKLNVNMKQSHQK